MHNVKMRIDENDVLYITIDLKVRGKPSKNYRRANEVIASTGGSLRLVTAQGQYRLERLNLSIWKPAEDEDEAAPTGR